MSKEEKIVGQCKSSVSKELEILTDIIKTMAILKLRADGKDECNYLEEMQKIGTSTQFQTIKQALLKAQEQEKVLKIIKEKPLSLLTLKLLKKYDKDEVIELNYQYFVEGYKTMTEDLDEDMKEQIASEEEFDLLKRWTNE